MAALQTDDEEEVKDFPRSNIYMSPDFLPDHEGPKNDKALVLI
jgi:hypothetical protein